MKLKNSIELEVESEGKKVSLICQNDTSLGFLYDAISQMKEYVKQKIADVEVEEEVEVEG